MMPHIIFRRFAVLTAAMFLLLGAGLWGKAEANTAPVANAGLDQIVLMESFVFLDGSQSFDPDADPITYSWVQLSGPTVTINNSTSIFADFTSPSVPVGGATVTIELTVSDGSLSASDTVNITVKNSNTAPVALAGPDQTVSEGASVTLDGSASYDPDGDPLNFGWFQYSGTPVSLSSNNTAVTTFTVPIGATSLLQFRLQVYDGIVITDDDVDIIVQPANQAPTADAGPNQTVRKRDLVTLDGTGSSDPDGDALTYSWAQTAGAAVILNGANSATPSFTAPNNADTLGFALTVGDGDLSSNPAATSVFVVDEHADPPLCSEAHVKKPSLWPPTHQMKEINIEGIFHKAKEMGLLTVTSITSDEPTTGLGAGDTGPDASVNYTSQVQDWGVETATTIYLRSERADGGNGRVYTINFEATNQATGDSCSGSVKVSVPIEKDGEATNSGQNYDALLF